MAHWRLRSLEQLVSEHAAVPLQVVSAVHTRSLLFVPSVEMYCPAACGAVGKVHVAWSVQMRLDVCVLAVLSYCVLKSHVVSGEQMRLDVLVLAVLSYWLAKSHVLSALQTRLDVSVLAVLSYWWS